MTSTETPSSTEPLPLALPQPGWALLDAVRDQRFTGAVVVAGEPAIRLFAERGDVYLAERADDPDLRDRLVALDAVTPEQLAAGVVEVGGVAHLGRLFERVPDIDRHAVLASVELMNAEVLTSLAGRTVHEIAPMPYRTPMNGVHAWWSPTSSAPVATASPLPAPPPVSPAPIEPAPPTESDPVVEPPVVAPPPVAESSVIEPPVVAESPVVAPPPVAESSVIEPPVVVEPPVVAPPPGAESPVIEPPVVAESPAVAEPAGAQPVEQFSADDAVISWDQPSFLDTSPGPKPLEKPVEPDTRGLGISTDWMAGLGIDLGAIRETQNPHAASGTTQIDDGDHAGDDRDDEPPFPPAAGSGGGTTAAPTGGGYESLHAERAAESVPVVWPSGATGAPPVADTSPTHVDRPGPTALLPAGRPVAVLDPPDPAEGSLADVLEINWGVADEVETSAPDASTQAAVIDMAAVVEQSVAACEDRVDPASTRSTRLSSLGGIVRPAASTSVFSEPAPAFAGMTVPTRLEPEERVDALRRLIGSLKRP